MAGSHHNLRLQDAFMSSATNNQGPKIQLSEWRGQLPQNGHCELPPSLPRSREIHPAAKERQHELYLAKRLRNAANKSIPLNDLQHLILRKEAVINEWDLPCSSSTILTKMHTTSLVLDLSYGSLGSSTSEGVCTMGKNNHVAALQWGKRRVCKRPTRELLTSPIDCTGAHETQMFPPQSLSPFPANIVVCFLPLITTHVMGIDT